MDNPAALSDLTGRGYAGSDGVGQTRLDAAWRALLLEVASIPASVAAGLLSTADVADVVADAAMRVLRNPEGLVEESGGVDDYRESRRRGDATEDLYFTAAELRRMRAIPIPTAGSQKYS